MNKDTVFGIVESILVRFPSHDVLHTERRVELLEDLHAESGQQSPGDRLQSYLRFYCCEPDKLSPNI